MTRPNITPGEWKVMADPDQMEPHPYHDNRYVATTDADPIHSDDTEGFYLKHGSLIVQTRDSAHQAANAKAIAAIPRMCAGLETAHKALTAEYERRQTSGVPEYIKEAWLALAAVHEAMTAAGYQF